MTKCISIVLVVGFILAFGCEDLLATEKERNLSGMKHLRGASFDASFPTHNLLYIEKIRL